MVRSEYILPIYYCPNRVQPSSTILIPLYIPYEYRNSGMKKCENAFLSTMDDMEIIKHCLCS